MKKRNPPYTPFLWVAGICLSGRLAAGPITFNTALPIAQGHWILRGQYVGVRASDDPTPLDRNLRINGAAFVLAGGLTPRLAAFAILPYLDKSLRVNTPIGHRSRGDSGLADVTLLARWTLFADDRPGTNLRVAPFAGVKLPTGRDDASDGLGQLPQPLQLGSGSWDGLGGATVTWQTLAWELDADAGYRRNGGANAFQFGDEAFADLSFQYRVWPRQLSGGVPGYLYAVAETNLTRQARNEIAGASDPDSGGTRWDVDFGLQYVTVRWIFEAVVRVPAVQHLHGSALKTNYQIAAGFRWNL